MERRFSGLCFAAQMAVVLLLAGSTATLSASPLYREDIEDADPVEFWTSNGEYEVHFKGISADRAFSGHRSFQLDITLKSGSYCYWAVPLRFPAAGDRKLAGRLFVEQAGEGVSVGLGGNFVFPPTVYSGCGTIDGVVGPSTQWSVFARSLREWARDSPLGSCYML